MKNRIIVANCVTHTMILILLALYNTAYTKNLSPNALSILNTTFISKKLEPTDIEPDISYLFADLKFDGDSLKICEFGPCPYAGMPTSTLIINGKHEIIKSPYWGIFWHYLKKFDIPVWCVGGKQKIHFPELKRSNGQFVANLLALKKNPKFKECVQKPFASKSRIADFAAIVIFAHGNKAHKVAMFEKQYPNVLVVNQKIGKFACHKNLMNPLFAQENLNDYKPRCSIYAKRYTSDLAQKIKSDLCTDTFIIKPIGSLQSRGVIMVTEQDLDTTLRMILTNDRALKNATHRSLRFWHNNNSSEFIVEAYAPSKTISVRSKHYDPTMRLVFCLSYENGIITTNVIGGFWKTPVKALNENGSLTQKHITIPFSGDEYVGLAISEKDMSTAKQLLASMLGHLYAKILDITHQQS